MRRRLVVAFLAPALILYLGFVVLPAVQAFYLSLFQTSGFKDEPRWVGLANYATLYEDPVFWITLTHMLLILLVGGAAVFGLAFLFTMLINSGLWGKKLFRALIFMPNILAVVALSTVPNFVFHWPNSATYYYSAGNNQSLPVRHAVRTQTNSDGRFMIVGELPGTGEGFVQAYGYKTDAALASNQLEVLNKSAAVIDAHTTSIVLLGRPRGFLGVN